MTNFTQPIEKVSSQSAILRSQSRALRSKCFDNRQRSCAILQRNSVLWQNIRSQSWYKSYGKRFHQEALLATEINRQKTQVLFLKIQEYLTLLLSNIVAINLKQVELFEREIKIIIENMNQVLDRYKFLQKEDEFRLECTQEKCMESINQIITKLKIMLNWVYKIRDRYDPDYQELIKIRQLTKKVYSTL